MTQIHKYKEQFYRMMRYYEHFRELDEGKTHTRPDSYYEDDVYSFFLSCYHLRDWIENDDTIKIPKPRREQLLDNFIKLNNCMKVCQDICHSFKHLKRNRGKERRFESRKKTLEYGGPQTKLTIKFVVDGNGPTDAFTLATECVQKWEEFIKNNKL